MRKDTLATGEIYHIFTRTIAGFQVLNAEDNCERFIQAMKFYQFNEGNLKLSKFLKLNEHNQKEILHSNRNPWVQIISYCLMPTHPHLILKQLRDKGITIFMSNILNSYTRYFNIKGGRKGPLWETEFKSVLIGTNEQLFHLTVYLHLNPTSDELVNMPWNWQYSSVHEYIRDNLSADLCNWDGLLDIDPVQYKKHLEDRTAYQRSISKIKHLTIEDYHA